METGRSMFLPIVLSVLVSAIIFGGLGYYVAKSQAPSATTTVTNDTTAMATETPEPVATASAEPTGTPTTTAAQCTAAANEKIYENTTYDFCFTYPATWSVSTPTDADSLVAISLNNPAIKADTDMPAELRVNVYQSVKKLDTESLGATTLKSYLDKYAALSDPKYQNVKAAKFGSKDGYHADAGPNQFGGGEYYFVAQSNNSIVKTWRCSESCSFDSDTMSKIISSFKFTQ